MSKRLTVASALSALGLWAATMVPANATIIARSTSFQYPCNGTNQTISFTLGGFPANIPLQIIGASLSLFANPGGVQFVTLSDAVGNVLASLGQGENHSQTIFSGLGLTSNLGNFTNVSFIVFSNASGAFPFVVVGNRTGNAGTPPVQGTVIVYFLQ